MGTGFMNTVKNLFMQHFKIPDGTPFDHPDYPNFKLVQDITKAHQAALKEQIPYELDKVATRAKLAKRLERAERALALTENKLSEAQELLALWLASFGSSRPCKLTAAQLRDRHVRTAQAVVDVKFVSYVHDEAQAHAEGGNSCPCNECRRARQTGCEFCDGDHEGECLSPEALQFHSFSVGQALGAVRVPDIGTAVTALALLPHLLREMKRLYEAEEAAVVGYRTAREQNYKLKRHELAMRRFVDALRAHANCPHDAELLAEEDEAYTALLALLEPEKADV